MPILTFFSRPIKINYRASRFSKAALFYHITTALNILVRWILVYRSDGLWRKIEFFQEQPTVRYNHDLILSVDIVNSSTPIDRIVWTTFSKINRQLNQNMIRSPLINVILFVNFLSTLLITVKTLFLFRILKLTLIQMEKMMF